MTNPDNGIHTQGAKEVSYHGLVFTREDKTGYYLNSTNRLRLHRFVWEQNNTAIPKGYHVHHLNGDKNDNTVANLRLLRQEEHLELHGKHLTEKQKAYLKSHKEKFILKATEWHKSEEGREWHRKHVKEQWHNWHKREKVNICSICGKEFLATRKARFCSILCKTKARREAGKDLETRTCEVCGKTFQANKYSTTRFCGVDCRGKAWCKRMEDQRKAMEAGEIPKREFECMDCHRKFFSVGMYARRCPECQKRHRQEEKRQNRKCGD